MGRMLATAGALASLVGCGGDEQTAIGPSVHTALAGAAIATVGTPGPQDAAFGAALVSFSQGLGRLTAADDDADGKIAWQMDVLATILERMPMAGAQPMLRRTAAAMRAATEGREGNIEDTKRALAAAATTLLSVARCAYKDTPGVSSNLRLFAGAVSAIDPHREPPDRAGVVTALVRAERALATMYAMNAMPP
jgi:hypothetical protein